LLNPVHPAQLVDKHPLVLHNLTRCHSDRPSLAMPEASGAVPHHCGDPWKKGHNIGVCHQPITPQEEQNVSLLDSSRFMLHWPQEGHRGSLLFFNEEDLGGRGLRLFVTAHPFFGRLTFGTNLERGWNSRN